MRFILLLKGICDNEFIKNISKMYKQLVWKPSFKFEEGIEKTVALYLENKGWL
jgi:dTDP-D-glucose 4,6-dehydratase